MTTEEILPQVEDQTKDQESNEVQKTQLTKEETKSAEIDGNSQGEDSKDNAADENADNGEQPQQHEVTPALATEGGREVSHKILYVGGLDKNISEDDLREVFSVDGAAQSVKILADKNRPGLNYAFVEYENEQATKAALDKLHGSFLNNSRININYAYQSQQAKNDPNAFNIFVGDLSTEVDDELLKKSFSRFKSLLQAHVMWDMQSGRSRGYGFVSFAEQADAEAALTAMNGEVIANRAIRLNWASHKQQQNGHGFRNYINHHHPHHHSNHHNGHHHRLNDNFQNFLANNGVIPPPVGGGIRNGSISNSSNIINPQSPQNGLLPNGTNGSSPNGPQPGAAVGMLSPQNYNVVLRKAPSWQTTVYLGNLARFTTENDLIPLLQTFGFIVDFRFLAEKNCAFVKYDSHERAALAIVQLNGFVINGRPLKSNWGKDRPNNANNNLTYQGFPPVVYGQGH